MKKSRYLRKTSGERGVALFFALGILAVLIVTVLVFANRATTDLKVASAYASSTHARHLVESAMNRAMANLSKNAAVGVSFYSEQTGGDNVNTFDWLWKLQTDEVSLTNKIPVRWQYVDNGETNPEIIGRYAYFVSGMNLLNLNALLTHNDLCSGETCDNGTGKLCSKHLGRSLAELTYDHNKLELFNSTGTKINFTKADLVAKRTGGTPDKIQTYGSFDLLKAYWSISSAMYGKRVEDFFMVTEAASQNEPDAWFIGDINSNGFKDKNEFFHRFNLNRDADTWRKMVVDGGYKTNAVDNIYKDINDANYAFYDASTGNVTDNNAGIPWLRNWTDAVGGWSAADVKAKQIIANLINYNAPVDTPVVSDINPENWDGAAANQPKYTGNKRTWYLNEAWFSVNTVCVPGAAIPVTSPDGAGNDVVRYYKWDNPTMQVKIELKPEIINMFKKDGNWPGNASEYSVKAYGTIKFKYGKNDFDTTSNENFTQKAMTYTEQSYTLTDIVSSLIENGSDTSNYAYFNITPSGGSYLYEGSFPVGGFAHNNDITADDTALKNGGYFTLNDLDVDLRLVLYKGTEAVDYVVLTKSATDLNAALRDSGKCSRDDYPYSFSLEVNDPRHNLHAVSWLIASDTDYAGDPFDKGSLLKVNSKFSVTGGDTETATDPAADASANKPRISTAYIRHGSMQSLWEIGAIHRADTWQTINLRKPSNAGSITDNLKTNISEKGGGPYAEGDFRILDQISIQNLKDDGSGNKIPVRVDKFGKINLNAAHSAVKNFTIDALFRGMVFHKNGAYDYNDATASEDQHVISAPSDDMVAALAAPVKDNLPLYRRTDIYLAKSESAFWKLFDGSLGIAQDTDAKQEQLIGRIIQLTKASTNYDVARLTVIAQSIKDVGGTGTSEIELPIDWDEDGDVTDTPDSDTAKKNAGYWQYGAAADVSNIFGAIPALGKTVKAKKGRYDVGADKITGTAKMSAYLLYDNVTQKWKLVWMRYE